MTLSAKTNKDEKQAENMKFSIIYTKDMKAWKRRRKETFRKNTTKTKAIVLEEFCTEIMIGKLREMRNYESELAENFTKLLKAIADVTYQTTNVVNPFWSLSKALSSQIVKHETITR